MERQRVILDNQGAIRLIKNPGCHKRTKHVDVRYHFIREKYTDGEILPSFFSSEDHLADLLAKALSET